MLNKLRLRLRALFFKSKMEDELQEELQFHLEREISPYWPAGFRRDARLRWIHWSHCGVSELRYDVRSTFKDV